MKRQKVVRTYLNYNNNTSSKEQDYINLQFCLMEGYIVNQCNKIGDDIEYILEKEFPDGEITLTPEDAWDHYLKTHKNIASLDEEMLNLCKQVFIDGFNICKEAV